MGIFSKKTCKCSRCGKEYEARMDFGLCPDCESTLNLKRDYVEGYLKCLGEEDASEERMDEIAAHKKAICRKYQLEPGISSRDMIEAATMFKRMSQEQIGYIVNEICKRYAFNLDPDVMTLDFLLPEIYPNTIVDFDDVFAVCYDSDKVVYDAYGRGGAERFLCVLYTNDPYLPIVPFALCDTFGGFQFKSKRGRNFIENQFSIVCKHLTYPVQTIGSLKKQLKMEKTVRGNIGYDKMMESLKDASLGMNQYNAAKMERKGKNGYTQGARIANEMGYFLSSEVDAMLSLDMRGNRKFWEPLLDQGIAYALEERMRR